MRKKFKYDRSDNEILKAGASTVHPFPTFGSLEEAEAYSEKAGDAYYEICYHLEGALNRCLSDMVGLYAEAGPAKRRKMQTGIVRERICPAGWPKHPKTLVNTFLSLVRYGREDTCHAFTVKEAMAAWEAETECDPALGDFAFDPKTFEVAGGEVEKARYSLRRLCDWIESRLHNGVHALWYQCPDCFSNDTDKVHLAKIGIAQRHLAKFSERDRKRWEGIHSRAAKKHQENLSMWGTVGKVQYDPKPRTWTHPAVDVRLIGWWPLVERYNWTYPDLLKVLDQLLPGSAAKADRQYPLDSEASLKVHCRSVCGLTKSKKGKSAAKMPEGWLVAQKIFA